MSVTGIFAILVPSVFTVLIFRTELLALKERLHPRGRDASN